MIFVCQNRLKPKPIVVKPIPSQITENETTVTNPEERTTMEDETASEQQTQQQTDESKTEETSAIEVKMDQSEGTKPKEEEKDEDDIDEEDKLVEPTDELDRLMNTRNEPIENESQADVVSYAFEISDIVLNIGPCGHSIVSESSGDQSEFESASSSSSSSNETGQPYSFHAIDLVTSSGFAKNGSVSLLQRSLRPDLIATFQLHDVIDMWSLANDSLVSPYSPTYLFLSKASSTVVLQIANEITELEKETSAFCTKSATIYCANFDSYLLQVTTSCVYLYNECLSNENGPQLAYSLDLADKIDSRIKHALSVDRYLVMLSEKGTIYMFELENTTQMDINDDTSACSPQLVEIDKVSEANFFFANLSCFTLYKDETSIFSVLTEGATANNNNNGGDLASSEFASKETNNNNESVNNETTTTAPNETSILDMKEVDDEEELLYGKAAESAETYIKKLLTSSEVKQPEPTAPSILTSSEPAAQGVTASLAQNQESTPVAPKKTTYWLVTVNFDGILNLIWLEGKKFELIYSIPRFNQAPKSIIPANNYKYVPFENQIDSGTTTGAATGSVVAAAAAAAAVARTSSIIESNQIVISEILLVNFGFERNRHFLVVKMDEDLVIYEAFLALANRKGKFEELMIHSI